MKDPINKTKIVIRHLPPSISQSTLMEQIDSQFSNRCKWFSFRAGKISHKNQRYSRAYIDFLTPEDVIEFADFFDGRTFVNEKGSQFKALVEYAPSQSVPKPSPKKDGREGTILKDPDYLEFLEAIAKTENLPSAEVQMERREAERAGGQKESIIVTPLMDFIRQRRAAKNESQQRISISGRHSRRAGEAVTSSPSSSKRGSEKRRGSTSMYVLRDNPKARGEMKDKSAYTILSRKEDQQTLSDFKTETAEVGNKISKPADGSNGTTSSPSGKVEISKKVPGILSLPNATASVRNIPNSTYRQRQRHETSDRIIRGILSNNNKSELRTQEVKSERDKHPPRPPNPHIKSYSSVSYNDGKRHMDGSVTILSNTKEKQQIVGDKDVSNSSIAAYDGPLGHGEIRSVLPNSSKNAENRSGRANFSLTENGTTKYVARRGKDGDRFPSYSEGKQSKRGMSTNYGSYDRQMWVQKSGSGS